MYLNVHLLLVFHLLQIVLLLSSSRNLITRIFHEKENPWKKRFQKRRKEFHCEGLANCFFIVLSSLRNSHKLTKEEKEILLKMLLKYHEIKFQ